jgi:putative addiction module component (TIGR02574 family)
VTAEAKKIFEQALALSEDERAALIEALSESLQGAEEDLSVEWKTEIARRIEAVERGESRLIPADEVEARLREVLRRV